MTRGRARPATAGSICPGRHNAGLTGLRVVCRYRARSALRRRWPEASGAAWLSEAERQVHDSLRDARRREAWLLGRLLAKELILDEALAPSEGGRVGKPAAIQIHSRDGLGRAVRPRVLLDGQLQDWSLSIAHSDESVLVALSETPGVSVGVDLAPIRAFGDRSVEMWLTRRERSWLHEGGGSAEPGWSARLWAIKEALYKAVNAGEAFAPGRIEAGQGLFGACHVRFDGAAMGPGCALHISQAEGEVAVIAAVAYRVSGGPR